MAHANAMEKVITDADKGLGTEYNVDKTKKRLDYPFSSIVYILYIRIMLKNHC